MASVGPITSAVEGVATSVGAGILLGSFVVGTLGTMLAWDLRLRELWVVTAGYFGGLGVLGLAVLDLFLR